MREAIAFHLRLTAVDDDRFMARHGKVTGDSATHEPCSPENDYAHRRSIARDPSG